MSSVEDERFENVTQLDTRARERWGWNLVQTGTDWVSWDEHDGYHGLTIDESVGRLTPDQVAWFRSQEWIPIDRKDGSTFVVPQVFDSSPPVCYHATPSQNWPGILADGLTTGRLANRATAGDDWADARDYIHVCKNIENSRKWVGDKLLGSHAIGSSWAIIRVDVPAAGLRIFCDPASRTGYILEADYVASRYIELIEIANDKMAP